MSLAPESEVKVRNALSEQEQRLGLHAGGLSRMTRFAEVIDGKVYFDFGNGKVNAEDAATGFAKLAHGEERFADPGQGEGGDGPTKDELAKMSPQDKIRLGYEREAERRKAEGRR